MVGSIDVANAKDLLIAQYNLIEGDRQLIGADQAAFSMYFKRDTSEVR
jgi:hypothetical protein